MTNKKRYITYSPRPVATKLDKIVALDTGKLYIQHAKCTRSLRFDFAGSVKNHYVFKTKRLAKKIPETKKFLREYLTLFDKEMEFKEFSFH